MNPPGPNARRRFVLPLLLILLSVCSITAALEIVNDEGNVQTVHGFSVRKEDSKIVDALEDFQRYRDKKAWEIAFRTISGLAEQDLKGMLPTKDGFFVSSRQRIWQSLASLPADGKEAYRLFNDAKAKQLFEQVQNGTAADEVATLRKIYDQYFITSIGDQAADRLGDTYFEAGDFLAAELTWGSILSDYPDTSLPKLRLEVKRGIALARAGRLEQLRELLQSVRSESAGQKVTIGGKEVVAADYLAMLDSAAATRPTAQAIVNEVQLPEADAPAWQVMFADDALNQALQAQIIQMGWNAGMVPLVGSAPASAVDGKRVYANWMGIVFAVDLQTGKLLWRTRKFSELLSRAQNLIQYRAEPDRYSVTVEGDRLYVTGMPLENPGQYRLVCLNAQTGAVIWSSNTTAPILSIGGRPLIIDGTIYVAGYNQNGAELSLLTFAADTGTLRSTFPLGQAQPQQNRYNGGMTSRTCTLLHRGGMIYMLTNDGALLAVNTSGPRLEWAFTYEGPPPGFDPRFGFGGEEMMQTAGMPGTAIIRDSVLYLKECGAGSLYAIDLAGPSLKWKRPAPSRFDTIASVGEQSILCVGYDLSSIDLQSRAMKWSHRLPVQNASMGVRQSDGSVYVYAGRGVYEFDAATGEAARIFRGADRDSRGGTLLTTPERLIAVSNVAITAYPTGRSQRARK